MTNLQLHNRELIPNLALHSAIQDWLQQHNTLLQKSVQSEFFCPNRPKYHQGTAVPAPNQNLGLGK
jgi:hypothetical protein